MYQCLLFLELLLAIGYCCSAFNHRGRHDCSDKRSMQQIRILEQILYPHFNASDAIRTILKNIPSGIWLTIGANTLDPIQNSNDPMIQILKEIPSWSKYFVEPIPVIYDQLRENVKALPNAIAINVAIGVNPATANLVEYLSMYCLKNAVQDRYFQKKGLDFWANQICSFNPLHVNKHYPKGEVVAINVTTLSPSLLLHKYNISSPDVVLIDTEGYDYKVLQNFPLARMRPSVLIYEILHLDQEDRVAAEYYLRSHCYAVFPMPDKENMFALGV